MKRSATFLAVLTALVFVAIGGVLVWFLSSKAEEPSYEATPALPAPSGEELRAASHLPRYENARYGFSLRYPEGLVVKEIDEGQDAFQLYSRSRENA
jgi:hypothetical protein